MEQKPRNLVVCGSTTWGCVYISKQRGSRLAGAEAGAVDQFTLRLHTTVCVYSLEQRGSRVICAAVAPIGSGAEATELRTMRLHNTGMCL